MQNSLTVLENIKSVISLYSLTAVFVSDSTTEPNVITSLIVIPNPGLDYYAIASFTYSRKPQAMNFPRSAGMP